METPIQTIKIYSQYKGTDFDKERWATLKMMGGKSQITERVELKKKKNKNT